MNLRKLPGALALGLPTAVLAHVLSFGSSHTLGGHAHRLVLDASLAAVCATMAALLVGALFIAAAGRSGSILAARCGALVPGSGLTLVSAALWFGGIERIEAAHGISLLTVAVALIAITIGVVALVRVGIRVLARLALLIFALAFAKRFTPRATFVKSPVRLSIGTFSVSTRFSRPPPVFS